MHDPSTNDPSMNEPSMNEPSMNEPSRNGPSMDGPSANGGWSGPDAHFWELMEDEFIDPAARRRRDLVRGAIIVLVVLAMIAAAVLPAFVSRRRAPEPEPQPTVNVFVDLLRFSSGQEQQRITT